MALEDTLVQITPQQILILTDAPEKIAITGAEYRHFSGGFIPAMRTLWYEVPALIKPDHFIWIQSDSWVLDAERWTDEFLEYDYIGAPWPVGYPDGLWDRLGYIKGKNVGNGGFALRSVKLMRFLAEHRDTMAPWLPEDDAICRKHRDALEAAGFRWGPEELAQRFSFEFVPPPPEGTFGFHGKFNFEMVLSPDRLRERGT